MAGSPKKTKKAAKAKGDKPKRPLSGYMKFVKGACYIFFAEENADWAGRGRSEYLFGTVVIVLALDHHSNSYADFRIKVECCP